MPILNHDIPKKVPDEVFQEIENELKKVYNLTLEDIRNCSEFYTINTIHNNENVITTIKHDKKV